MDALVNIIYKFLFRITTLNNDLNNILAPVSNLEITGVGYIIGTDQIIVYIPFINANKYSNITIRPLAGRGTTGMLFNESNLPTSYTVSGKSAQGFIVTFIPQNPNSNDRYKVCCVQLLVTAS